MAPHVPRYVSPRERAENRARIRRLLYWTAVAIPATIMLMMVGYSDQAPAWLRDFTVAVDRIFGFPILALLKAIASH
jgi:hypothetical protein